MNVDRLPPRIQKAASALLTGRARTPARLRQAVEAYVARLAGADRTMAENALPADLIPYLNKVALYAYKVTDDDIARLKQAGYSEDELFEITLSAALGAGLARIERGLDALKGGQ
jgi:hypothetical protein